MILAIGIKLLVFCCGISCSANVRVRICRSFWLCGIIDLVVDLVILLMKTLNLWELSCCAIDREFMLIHQRRWGKEI